MQKMSSNMIVKFAEGVNRAELRVHSRAASQLVKSADAADAMNAQEREEALRAWYEEKHGKGSVEKNTGDRFVLDHPYLTSWLASLAGRGMGSAAGRAAGPGGVEVGGVLGSLTGSVAGVGMHYNKKQQERERLGLTESEYEQLAPAYYRHPHLKALLPSVGYGFAGGLAGALAGEAAGGSPNARIAGMIGGAALGSLGTLAHILPRHSAARKEFEARLKVHLAKKQEGTPISDKEVPPAVKAAAGRKLVKSAMDTLQHKYRDNLANWDANRFAQPKDEEMLKAANATKERQ